MTQNDFQASLNFINQFKATRPETKQSSQQNQSSPLVNQLEEDYLKFIVLGDVPKYDGSSIYDQESNQENYKILVTKKGNRYYDENGVRIYICKQCSYKNSNHRALGGHVQKKHRYQIEKKITKSQTFHY